MYRLFLTLRYLRKRQIAFFAIAAIMLCTAMVLIVMSVMGGFLDTVKQRARGLLGDVIVDNKRFGGFPLYDEFIAEISNWPEIAKATPIIYTFGLLRFRSSGATHPVSVVGVRLDEVRNVSAFGAGLYYDRLYPGTTTLADQQQPLLGRSATSGIDLPEPYRAALLAGRASGAVDDDATPTIVNRLLHERGHPGIPGFYAANETPDGIGPPVLSGEPAPGIIIGRDIVARRQPDGRYTRWYPRGEEVALTIVPTSLSGSIDTPKKLAFRYADDSRTGIFEIDSKHSYVDFENLQRLLLWDAAERADGTGVSPGRCSQIQIKVKPGVDADALCARLTAAYRELPNRIGVALTTTEWGLLQDIEAVTWEQSQVHVIGPVENERNLVTMLFGIISIVAIVLVMCILYMIALQKTRDIGIVKSIGGSSVGVASIFLCYGAAVGVVGGAMGAVFGYVFVRHINDFQAILTDAFGWRVWDRSVYSFDDIPSTVRPDDLARIFLVAILASTFGAVAAAWRAGTMHPVEALRHE